MGLIQADLPQRSTVYGHGQGQAEPWLIWEEACLTLDLLSLNHISRLSAFGMQQDLFARLHNLWKRNKTYRNVAAS